MMALRSVAVGCVYSACFTQYVFICESVLGVLRNLEQRSLASENHQAV